MRQKVIIIAAAVILAGGLIGLAAISRSPQEQALTNPPAIPFSGQAKTGQLISFSKETIQKPTLLVFWAPWCPHCQKELPILEQIWQDPKTKEKINIIAVRVFYKSSKPTIINDDDFSFPIILAGQAIGEEYNISAVPTLIFVDKDFKIRERTEGALSKEELIRKINYLVFAPDKLAGVATEKVRLGRPAPDAVFTTFSGEERLLREFRGRKVMFWLLATWCPSCIAGAQVLAQNNDKLSHLTIIALKTYGNAGYPGPSIEEFAKQNAPSTLSAANWLWAEASPAATKIYNPRNFPDIYFLIDENGVLRAINSAPAATLNKIIEFAGG